MRVLVTILVIFILASCNPKGLAIDNQPLEPPTIEKPDNPNPSQKDKMKIIVGDRSFTVTLLSNPSVSAFKSLLPLFLTMNDFNNNEKVSSLPSSLPTNATSVGRISNGDVMLYGSRSLVLFYDSFATSYSYTSLGVVDNPSGFKEALEGDIVYVKFELE